MNNIFASISLNLVGDNNDSTIITFLSLGAIRACLKKYIILFLIPKHIFYIFLLVK